MCADYDQWNDVDLSPAAFQQQIGGLCGIFVTESGSEYILWARCIRLLVGGSCPPAASVCMGATFLCHCVTGETVLVVEKRSVVSPQMPAPAGQWCVFCVAWSAIAEGNLLRRWCIIQSVSQCWGMGTQLPGVYHRFFPECCSLKGMSIQ